jgi:hypothetical protein
MLLSHFPETDFVQSHHNIGFGRSNNLGFQYVKGEALLLLNPDTELKPAAVQSLLHGLYSHRDAGILGPRLLNRDGTLQTSCVQSLPTPLNQAVDSNVLRRIFPESRLWGVGEAFRATSPVPVAAVSGACMLLRTEVFRRVRGFSEEFFMYGEDMDLCAKVHRFGLQVYHVPSARVVHHGSGSSGLQVGKFSTLMTRVAVETYMRLNHGQISALCYRLLQGVSALVRLFLLSICCLPPRGERYTIARLSMKKWCWILWWALWAAEIPMPPETRSAHNHLRLDNDPGINHCSRSIQGAGERVVR